ncbi:hypothetical protein [Sphaerochaeta sp. PS]|uniref:hypothetical protein n=1 Tax=Sphaerochaeta sp. PS TaxID=3076336 RepID=UPI0028A38376|nr:hypothetical protein [Sphaerochaeta sp. PS]MDT4763126.1 hypothetical protein [Sphaerochaeta sp. PS]
MFPILFIPGKHAGKEIQILNSYEDKVAQGKPKTKHSNMIVPVVYSHQNIDNSIPDEPRMSRLAVGTLLVDLSRPATEEGKFNEHRVYQKRGKNQDKGKEYPCRIARMGGVVGHKQERIGKRRDKKTHVQDFLQQRLGIQNGNIVQQRKQISSCSEKK